MKEKEKDSSKLKAYSADRFIETLRKTLEHIHDPEWLATNSSLASILFTGTVESNERHRQVVLSGRQEVDQRLRAIWHEWETNPKTPLQSVLWEAICKLPTSQELPIQATLLLTYFALDKPKQSQVIKLLAIGRSTYYRHLEKAITTLSDSITRILRPALRLEMPVQRTLVGRLEQSSQAQAALIKGQVVQLIGGSGLGKSALGAHLAAQWPHKVFWYTFRAGLTDYLEQLLYSIAYFLHQHQQSGLWLYLTASNESIDTGRAILALRQHLHDLADTPPLFCFDEVDLLLSDELNDSEEHLMLRSLLEEWSQTERSNSPLLLIGQKLLLEPEVNGVIRLQPFTKAELALLMKEHPINVTDEQAERIAMLTRGNPLLVNLFLTVSRLTSSITESIEQLTTPVTLDWFLVRLSKHLKPQELTVLHELSVFSDSAPISGWVRTRKHLDTLIDLGLVVMLQNSGVSLHPALRTAIYRQLPAERKRELHVAAGHLLADHGRFTAAARHYIDGGQPELAIWTWYTHQEEELEQGQANAALDLFAQLQPSGLSRSEDQQALALLLSPLLARAGRSREGLALMEDTHWKENTVSSVYAHELRGELYAEVGEIDRSLNSFRQGLNAMGKIRSTYEADLHLQIARRTLVYQRDIEQTAQELRQANLTLRTLQGTLERNCGNYDAARAHYSQAITIANEDNNIHRLAMLHESLGILEALEGNLDEAVAHYNDAARYFQSIGNMIAAVGNTNSGLAFAYLLQRHYAEAIAPAEKSLAFFKEIGHAYWIAVNATYLTEAWLYLDELEKAEAYAHSALAQEEVVVRPYCLYLLGHVRRRQGLFKEAERYCQEAIEIAEEFEDPAALAPAWSALGETLRDAGQTTKAREALSQSLAFWEQVDNKLEIEQTRKLLEGLPEAENC